MADRRRGAGGRSRGFSRCRGSYHRRDGCRWSSASQHMPTPGPGDDMAMQKQRGKNKTRFIKGTQCEMASLSPGAGAPYIPASRQGAGGLSSCPAGCPQHKACHGPIRAEIPGPTRLHARITPQGGAGSRPARGTDIHVRPGVCPLETWSARWVSRSPPTPLTFGPASPSGPTSHHATRRWLEDAVLKTRRNQEPAQIPVRIPPLCLIIG